MSDTIYKIVFINQYIPFLDDKERKGRTPDPKIYYSWLIRFFKKVKKKFGIKVLIAERASDCSFFDRHPYFIKGYERVKGETEKVIEESLFTLAHNSKAIRFAVKYCKPIIFMNFKFKTSNWYENEVNKEAEKLGKSPIYIDREYEIDWDKELGVDKEKYDSY